jgi:DmsE family decaheme c-type cytochrome
MKRRALVFLSILSVFALVLIAQNSAKGDSGFVGSEACKDCHEGYYNTLMKSVHGKKVVPGSPVNREGCESCHGPGAQHAEKGGGKGVAIFVFARGADVKTRASKCLGCHEESKHLASWDIGKHKSAGISCDNCHSIHKPGNKSLKIGEPDLCYSCHKYIRTQQNKQSHHPVNEGRIKCSNCHEVHGTFGPRMVKADSVNDLCYTCHAEKRGPFAFEHPPVQENCLNCHEIHGSNHSKLLVRKVPFLCQSCHTRTGHPSRPATNFHSFGGLATANKNKFYARSCLNCHGNIHGSSRSATFDR